MREYIRLFIVLCASLCLAVSYMFFYMGMNKKEVHRMDIIQEAVDKFGPEYNMDKELLWAIMDTETGGFRKFIRNDKRKLMSQKWFVDMLTNQKFKLDAGNKLTYCSIGVMQVLFPTARYLGFEGTPEDFISGGDKTNIKYGCMFLAHVRKLDGDHIWDMTAGYNAGRARTYWKEGIKYYRNQRYVDKVYFKYEMYGGKNL